MTVYDLDRNDIDGALEVYARALAEGRETEVAQVLVMLQDDPSELIRRMLEVSPDRSPASE